MRILVPGLIALSLFVTGAPAALINFDDLTASSGGVATPGGITPFVGRTVPSGYSSLMSFAVPTGDLFVYAEAVDWSSPPAASLPNVVCPAQVALASSSMCTEPLIITFSQAVNGLSFWAGAWDDVGALLLVQIFTGTTHQLASELAITSPQRANTHGIINVSQLSGIADITRLRIVSPVSSLTTGAGDRNGLVYDNFVFDGGINPPPSPDLPEPGTAVLALAGALTIAFSRAWRARR